MAVSRGCLGIIKVKDAAATGAASQILRIRDYSVSESSEQLDASEIGDCTTTTVAGRKTTTININGWYDTSSGANQSDMTNANDVYAVIYPAGTGTGKPYLATPTGGANIQERVISGGTDNIVEVSWTMTVNGAVTEGTAT